MSRKGVIAKRVKTAPDGSIENQRPTAQSGWPRNDVPRSAKVSVRLKSRPKSNHRPITITTRETFPRSAKHTRHATPRTTMRASREQASRPRNPSRTTADASVRAGKTSHVRPRNHRPNLIRPTTPADRETSGHDRSDSAKTRLSGRSSRPTVRTPRSTRSRF
ncbi:unnamed protein product [Microthlaspi erraticum]|uniref:Uncharacterized protein n=1 Tax=Microthlaspi erraticum TaxID=1685480 RepID=A0A6D2IU28_9BRAS|nr:unnamed protein product [Microthlaspi erraticum]